MIGRGEERAALSWVSMLIYADVPRSGRVGRSLLMLCSIYMTKHGHTRVSLLPHLLPWLHHNTHNDSQTKLRGRVNPPLFSSLRISGLHTNASPARLALCPRSTMLSLRSQRPCSSMRHFQDSTTILTRPVMPPEPCSPMIYLISLCFR